MMYSIGDVTIRKIGENGLGLCGQERHDALRHFFAHRKPPEGFEAIKFNPLTSIPWDKVRWDTAGVSITREAK